MSIGRMKIHALRLVGSVGVLDFLNTCQGRAPASAQGSDASRDVPKAHIDYLYSLDDVVYWFRHAQLISAEDCEALQGLVSQAGRASMSAFYELIAFRECLRRLLLPVAQGAAVEPQCLEELNQALALTAGERILVPDAGGAFWRWREADSIERLTLGLIGRMAVQAADLLTSSDLARLKVCAAADCGWLFVDTSKNGRRRWCQMSTCGSRAKAMKSSAPAWLQSDAQP